MTLPQQNEVGLQVAFRRFCEDGLPSNTEAERAILGGIMLDNSLLAIVSERLMPQDFSDVHYRRIFSAMQMLDHGSAPIDPILLFELLKHDDAIVEQGGVAFLATLPDGMERKPNLSSYIQIVEELSDLRQIIIAAHSAYESALCPRAKPNEIRQKYAHVFRISEPPEATPAQEGEDGWPEPMAADSFHGPAGDFVRLLAPESEADPASLYLQTLAVTGSIIGREAYCRVRETRHHANLYNGIVGETAGARKGLGGDSVVSLGRMIDELWADKCVVSGISSGEFLIDRVKDTEPPSFPQRLMVFEDELGFLLSSAKRESSTISSVLRSGWDGKHVLQVGAKQSGAIATDAHISLVGHITREELLNLLTENMVKGGLVNRILWSCSRRSKLLPEGGAQIDFRHVAGRIADAVQNAKGAGCIERDHEAAELWDSLYREIESTPRTGMFGKATCRASAQTLRLSLLFAVLDCERTIRVPHIEAARAVWQYSENSARFIFGGFIGNEDSGKILVALREHGPMNKTDIANQIFHKHRNTNQIDAALNALELSRKVRREKQKTKGRDSEVWIAV